MPPIVVYRIKNWNTFFENNRTRELKRMDWVPVPNQMDGDGYTELLDHPDGAAHFGAWIALVEVASRCKPRGTLLREGAAPHDIHSLSRITRISKSVFESAIPRLLKVGWLDVEASANTGLAAIPQDGDVGGGTFPHHAAEKRLRNGTERNGTERNNSCSEPAGTPPSEPAGKILAADFAAGPIVGPVSGSAPAVVLTAGLVEQAGRSGPATSAGKPFDPAAVAFPDFPVCGGCGRASTGTQGGGGTWRMSDARISELAATFPGVDVPTEARKAHGWIRANLRRRKTYSGMDRFLFSWLSRAQDRGGGPSGPAEPGITWGGGNGKPPGPAPVERSRDRVRRLLEETP